MYRKTLSCLMVGAVIAPTFVEGQDSTPVEPVAVYVNGHPITQADVDRMLLDFIKQQAQGRRPTPQAIENARDTAEAEMINVLVEEYLIEEEFKKRDLTISEEEYQRQTDIGLARALAGMDMTREEYGRRMLESTGMSLVEVVKRKSTNPTFRKSVQVIKLLESRYPKDMMISDERVEKHYNRRKNRDYIRPAQVRASHILIGTANLNTDKQKEEAHKKATHVLAEANKEGADFTALAKEHSTDPSASKGGDLGYFPRDGALIEVLASASFDLNVGEVSGLTKSPAGYHIIKVTGRKKEQIIPLDEAKEWIRYELKGEQVESLRGAYLSELRAKADIHYP